MAEGRYDDQISAMQVQITQLQRENQKMQTALAEVANANVLPRVLENGFADMIAELKPLRDLTPQREPLNESIAAALAAMLNGMKGIPLPGGSLGIPEVNIPFIGQPRRPVFGTPGGTPLPGTSAPDPYQIPGKTTLHTLGEGYRP